MKIINSKDDILEKVMQMAENYEYWHKGRDLMGDDYNRKRHLREFTTDLRLLGPRFGEDWEEFLEQNCTTSKLDSYMDAKYSD